MSAEIHVELSSGWYICDRFGTYGERATWDPARATCPDCRAGRSLIGGAPVHDPIGAKAALS